MHLCEKSAPHIPLSAACILVFHHFPLPHSPKNGQLIHPAGADHNVAHKLIIKPLKQVQKSLLATLPAARAPLQDQDPRAHEPVMGDGGALDDARERRVALAVLLVHAARDARD